MRLLFIFFFSTASFVGAKGKEDLNVKYKSGKRVDFESLLVEGQRKRAELSVVTGNVGEENEQLIKKRENFNDYMAMELGEELQ